MHIGIQDKSDLRCPASIGTHLHHRLAHPFHDGQIGKSVRDIKQENVHPRIGKHLHVLAHDPRIPCHIIVKIRFTPMVTGAFRTVLGIVRIGLQQFRYIVRTADAASRILNVIMVLVNIIPVAAVPGEIKDPHKLLPATFHRLIHHGTCRVNTASYRHPCSPGKRKRLSLIYIIFRSIELLLLYNLSATALLAPLRGLTADQREHRYQKSNFLHFIPSFSADR